MTDHPISKDEASDDPTPVRVARIWQKRRPRDEGSLGTSLKAMDVLYDAGEPLTREEFERRLLGRLDPYEQSYLKAWHVHRREVVRRNLHRYRQSQTPSREIEHKGSPSISQPEIASASTKDALHSWITSVFLKRLKDGQTLKQTADGRLMPGPGAPRIARADGRVLPYTPESREQFAQEDRAAHRDYLAMSEWTDLLKELQLPNQAAHAQLLTLLIRRLLVGVKTNGHKLPLDERIIGPKLNRLISLADTPAVRKAILQRALDALWIDPKPSKVP